MFENCSSLSFLNFYFNINNVYDMSYMIFGYKKNCKLINWNKNYYNLNMKFNFNNKNIE